MSTSNPIDLLFGGMTKLGPGGDVHTRCALRLLPRGQFEAVVDAGCGAGRQTLVLAKELATLVHAVDSYEPFLSHLKQQAQDAEVARFVQTHCMDMKDIPRVFQNVDLLWSEGAAYNIGFANALATWATALSPGGFLVVSELTWIREKAPNVVREFFEVGYPGMQTVQRNVNVAEVTGYKVLETYTLPDETWLDGYYEILEPRAKALLEHSDEAVREFASETVREIEVFGQAEGSYGYVFYILQRI